MSIGIDSMSSSMSMMQSSGMRRPQQPPPDKDVFKMTDQDSDGLVSSTELETLTQGISETLGTQISVDEAIANFDADQDGSLNGEELKGLMDSVGLEPPNPAGGANGEAMGMQGMEGMQMSSPSSASVISAYQQNSGDDQISQLINYLTGQGSEASTTSLNMTV